MESRPAEPRILIVDDEPADVDVLSECLGAAGYAVAVAEDGERALDLCRQHPPDAVLLDIVLSGIDGFETCRRLKADGRTRDVPVLFITVLTDMGDRLKSFLVGGVDYIVKPFHREEVLARLGAHLAVRTLQRALVREVEERRVAQAALARANEELEARVADRTADLAAAIARLRAEIEVREQTESQLRQAQKMEVVGRLTGGVAHDFNNVLTVILGSADLVRHALPEGSPLHQHVANIRGAAERAAALTGRLLAFSRRQALQISVVDVNAIVGSVIGMVRRLIGEDIELITRLDPLLHRVRIDPTQLEQVILNLALNARDAMPGGGQLTIETADAELDEAYAQQHAGVAAGLYAMLAVSDTGVGMDDLTRARVFEPFFTTKAPGAGRGSVSPPSTPSFETPAATSGSTARPAGARRSRCTCRASRTRPRSRRRSRPLRGSAAGPRPCSSWRTTIRSGISWRTCSSAPGTPCWRPAPANAPASCATPTLVRSTCS